MFGFEPWWIDLSNDELRVRLRRAVIREAQQLGFLMFNDDVNLLVDDYIRFRDHDFAIDRISKALG